MGSDCRATAIRVRLSYVLASPGGALFMMLQAWLPPLLVQDKVYLFT